MYSMNLNCRKKQVLKVTAYALVFVLCLIIYVFTHSESKKIIQTRQVVENFIHVHASPSSFQSNTDDVSAKVFTYTLENTWQINTNVCSKLQSRLDTAEFPKHFLNTREGKLYLYTLNTKYDGIAAQISRNNKFEPKLDVLIRFFMDKDPNLGFIDIGANVGVRSLQVSYAGWPSIAIEALDENIERLCASVILNKLENKLIIVHNAISDTHDVLNISLSNWGGRGGTFIDNPQVRNVKEREEGKGRYKPLRQIYSTTLDDLLKLPGFFPRFSKVFMKLDVEGFEHKALGGGSHFFQLVNVTGIIMEWRWHKGQPSALNMVNRLQKI